LLRFIGSLEGSVLDIGCGQASWSSDLRAAGAARVIGLEPDSVLADIAAKHCDLVIESYLSEITFLDNWNIKTVILADVLEHLLDPWSLLREVHERAEAGTRLFVSTPNLQSASCLTRVAFKGEFEYSDGGGFMDRGHIRWFTHRSLARAVSLAGFSIVRIEGGKNAGRMSSLLKPFTTGSLRFLRSGALFLEATVE